MIAEWLNMFVLLFTEMFVETLGSLNIAAGVSLFSFLLAIMFIAILINSFLLRGK